MSLFTEQLEQYRTTQDLVEIYRESLVPTAIVGRVIAFSDHVVLVEQRDDTYSYDGIVAVRPVDVSRVRSGHRELRIAGQLAQASSGLEVERVALLGLPAAATALHKRFGCVTLHAEHTDPGSAYTGELLGLDDDYILLRQWGILRNMDKYTLLLGAELPDDDPCGRSLSANA